MGTTSEITVTGNETIEEVYFLVRVGSWHQEHLDKYLMHHHYDAYNAGHDAGCSKGYNDREMLDSHEEGYSQGLRDGEEAGYDKGYDAGYRDGQRDADRSAYD